ncbi:hypothetical protein [Haladaptatus sp. CMAA 1911]|uniref:DUF7311 family protein n=1 Tax=unclassified Haladaptatus TaxID=2622732 RepID=UPI0037551C12
MSVRTVLAVLLVVAICSVSYPAIDAARRDRAAYRADAELAEVSRSMVDLADETAVPFDDTEPVGARRMVALSLPAESATTGKIEFVAIGGVPGFHRSPKDDFGDVLAYRVEGGRTRVRHLPFDVRVATRSETGRELVVRPDEQPLVVRAPTRRDIALLLVDYGGNRTLLVVPAAEL